MRALMLSDPVKTQEGLLRALMIRDPNYDDIQTIKSYSAEYTASGDYNHFLALCIALLCDIDLLTLRLLSQRDQDAAYGKVSGILLTEEEFIFEKDKTWRQ